MSTTADKTGQKVAEGLRAQGVAPGAGTAAGVAASGRKGENTAQEPESEVPKGGGMLEKGAKAVGLQAEPAIMTPSGSIESNMIASPTGPIPVGLVARSEEDALTMREKITANADPANRASRRKLTAAEIQGLRPAALRAVAWDRGYDIGEGGRRVLQAKFTTAQDEDESLESLTKAQEKDLAARHEDAALITTGTGAISVAGIPVATENRALPGLTPEKK